MTLINSKENRQFLLDVRCKCGHLLFKIWKEPTIAEGVCKRCGGKTLFVRELGENGQIKESSFYQPKRQYRFVQSISRTGDNQNGK